MLQSIPPKIISMLGITLKCFSELIKRFMLDYERPGTKFIVGLSAISAPGK
jgi:hypothetical protein